MKHHLRLFTCTLGLFYFTNLFAVTATSPYSVGLLLGTDLFSQSQPAQDVVLSSAVTNRYDAAKPNTGLHLVGLNFGYQFNSPIKISWMQDFDLIVGADLLQHSVTFSGTETPYINYGGGDQLNYSYGESNLALLGQAKLIYDKYSWRPYGLLGFGPSYNKLSNYQESAADPDSTATPLPPYQSHTALAFAYQLGFGVQKNLYKNFGFSTDLRYISFGDGYLKAPDGAYDSGAKLEANNSDFFGLTISATYQF